MAESKDDIVERTFRFGGRIIRLCVFLFESKGVSRLLASQLFRSGTSVGANVEESQSAESPSDFVHKLAIALKEARETSYWLRQLIAEQLVPVARVAGLADEAEQVKRLLGAIVRTKRRNMKKKRPEEEN